GHADAVLDRPRLAARRVPFLVPAGQLAGDLDLALVEVVPDCPVTSPGSLIGRQVAQPQLQGIQVEPGGQVIDGRFGQVAALRVARRPHGPHALYVQTGRADVALAVGDLVINIGQGLEVDGGPGAHPRASVGVHVKGLNDALLIRANANGAID